MDMSQIFDMPQSVSKEVEDEANSYFQRIYNHPPHPTLSIEEVSFFLCCSTVHLHIFCSYGSCSAQTSLTLAPLTFAPCSRPLHLHGSTLTSPHLRMRGKAPQDLCFGNVDSSSLGACILSRCEGAG